MTTIIHIPDSELSGGGGDAYGPGGEEDGGGWVWTGA